MAHAEPDRHARGAALLDEGRAGIRRDPPGEQDRQQEESRADQDEHDPSPARQAHGPAIGGQLTPAGGGGTATT